jgi:hypothetical protein
MSVRVLTGPACSWGTKTTELLGVATCENFCEQTQYNMHKKLTPLDAFCSHYKETSQHPFYSSFRTNLCNSWLFQLPFYFSRYSYPTCTA